MNAIKMDRLDLLEIVKTNKEKHISAFVESVADYKQLVLQTMTANLKLAKTANLEEFGKIKSAPPKPTSYENSYTRAIRMLELSVDIFIEVEEDIFNQLVLDEWQWKHAFVASNATYKAGAF